MVAQEGVAMEEKLPLYLKATEASSRSVKSEILRQIQDDTSLGGH